MALRGLPNPVNTCYLNATLQCLMHTRAFRKVLLVFGDDLNITTLLFSGKRNLNYHSIYKHMLIQAQKMLKPLHLAEFNDAGETMIRLLDWYHEKGLRTRLPSQEIFRSKWMSDMNHMSDVHFMKSNSIIADQFFMKQFVNTVCGGCGHINTNFEYLSVLHVVAKSYCLKDAIFDYFKPEYVPDWICDRCNKKHHNSTRTPHLWTTGSVVVIVIESAWFENGAVVKNKHDVRVEDTLCLHPFVVHPKAPRSFRLRSVCTHHGDAYYGHYTASIRKDERWILYDDDKVTSQRSVRSPYMLFYETDTIESNP